MTPYCNFTSGFDFDYITAVDMSAQVCEILSKLDRPRLKNDVMSIFKMVEIGLQRYNNGFFEKPMYDFL